MSSSLVGLAVGTATLLLLPASMAARILLLAPLVVVPALVCLVDEPAVPRIGPVTRLAGWWTLVAAVPLVGAYWLTPGPGALALALPWLVLTGVLGVAALLDGLRHLAGIRRRETLDRLLGDAALGYLAVGAAFLGFDRLAVAPFGFAPEIILLTAVHFHYAGFALLLVGATLAHRFAAPALTIAALALAVGMLVTAAAFLLDSDPLNMAGVLLVVVGALGAAVGLMTTRRLGLVMAGLLLLMGVPFGLAWAAAPLLGTPTLDFNLMVRIHGGLNATGILVAALFLPRWRR